MFKFSLICIKMEERENFGGGNAVVGGEVPVSFHVAPRIENNLDFSMATVPASSPAMKKKRGRPRKYGPDGKAVPGAVTALSPMPISSSIPLTGEFSGWKRGRGRPVESIKKSSLFKYDFESPIGPGIVIYSPLDLLNFNFEIVLKPLILVSSICASFFKICCLTVTYVVRFCFYCYICSF